MARQYKAKRRSGFYLPHDLYVDVLLKIPDEKRLLLIDTLAMYSKAEADGEEFETPILEYPDSVIWNLLKDAVDSGIARYEAHRHKGGNENKPPGGEHVLTGCNLLEHELTGVNNRIEENRIRIEDEDDCQGITPDLQSNVEKIASAFHQHGFVYDNHGKGGSLEGAIFHELKTCTPEQMQTALETMAEETKRYRRKKIRDQWAYYLTVLASVIEIENHQS